MARMFVAAVLLAQFATGGAPSGPAPSPTPISWELQFRFLDPQRIEVQLPGRDEPEVYWYLVYTAVNPTDRTQKFFPHFQFVTEDLKVFDTDMGISPLVFDAIRERHKITHKYLVSPTKAIGDLLSGEDNALESVAIWRDVNLKVNKFTIYVAGLSGETRVVKNPKYDPEKPETVSEGDSAGRTVERVVNPKTFTLRKTLEVQYNLPGSPDARPFALPERGELKWIMR